MADFRLILLLFPGKFLAYLKYLSAIQETSDETFQLAILSCLYSLVLEFVLSFDFGFISWEYSYLFEILIGYSRSEWRNPSAGYFFEPYNLVPEFVLRVPIVVLLK